MDTDSKTTEEWNPLAKVYNPLKAGSIDGTDVEAHDHGIIRALNAKYRPNKNVCGDPMYTLFVARLSPKTTEDSLRQAFSNYGDIRRIRLVRDIVTGFSKGYAFVEFEEERSAKKAHRNSTSLVIDGNDIFVEFECERTLKGWIPRRFGGGFGGKKEAGQLRFGGLDRPHRKPIVVSNAFGNNRDISGKLSSSRGSDREYQHRTGGNRRPRSRSRERRRRSRSRSRSQSRSRNSSHKRH